MRDNFDLYSWNKKRYLKEGINDRISRINVVYTTFGNFMVHTFMNMIVKKEQWALKLGIRN